MKIAIINLASEASRWLAVSKHFRRLGLHPVHVAAVRGGDLDLAQSQMLYSDALNRRQYHRPLCAGEIGCYASHLAAWRALLESRDRCLAVFEDDVEPDAALPAVLQAIDGLLTPWDMVKLIGRRHEATLGDEPLLDRHRLVRYRRVPSLTGGYVLHRRGAAKLLQARLPFGRPIDVDLRHWWECALDVRGVLPYPVQASPDALASTIETDGERHGPRDRWRKLRYQAAYAWQNWRATRGLRGAAAAAHLLPRPRESRP